MAIIMCALIQAMMERYNKYLLIAYLILSWPQLGQADSEHECIAQGDCSHHQLTIGSSNSFPPINFLSDSGELDGFGRDISDAALGSLGIKIKRKHSAIWTEVLSWLDQGQIDLIHDTGYTEDRDQYLDYSLPIIEMPEVIFVREDRLDINEFEDLKEKKVACVNRHITHLYIQQFPEIQCHIVKRPVEGLTALLAGDVDAFVYPKEIILYFAQTQKLSNKVKIVGEPIRKLSWSMTVKEGNSNTLALINEGIRRIKASGQYDEIYNQWFGIRVLSGYSEKEVQYIVLASILVSTLLVISLFLFYYNHRISFARDELQLTVDELEKARDELATSEARYSEIGLNIPGAIYQFLRDADGQYYIPFISKGIEKIIGLPSGVFEDDVGRFFARIPDEYRDKMRQSIEESARTQKPWRFDFPFESENKGTVWFRGTSLPDVLPDGGMLWNGMLLDITELHHFKNEHDSFFELSADMLCIADFDGYFIDISQAWERNLGFSIDELKAKPFIEFVHPADRATTIAEAERLATQPGMTIGFTNRYMCKDGSFRWLDWNAITVPESNKIFAVAHDITILKQTADDLEVRVKDRTVELEKAKILAENANHAKSAFLSNMSHELRTPLNAILGFAQLIQYQYTQDKSLLENTNEIVHAGKHLLSLIDEILDLSKIESGRIQLEFESFELNVLFQDCIKLITPSLKRESLTIVYEPSECSCVVYADYMRLKQVLLNLLSNSVKYNKHNGSITISCCEKANALEISVTDTGVGIRKEDYDKVFRPFERLDVGHHIEGTGIGLSLTKRLIEEMKGTISFKSEHGKGSTFSIDVLLSKNDVVTQRKEFSDVSAIIQPVASPSRTKRIVYIEDNPANMRLVNNILGKLENIEVMNAALPLDGLEMIKQNEPDLVLLDINLPEMDGYQVKQAMEEHPKMKDIKVVAISANAMESDIKRGQEAGFVDYITKPIDVSHFLDVVMKALG